MPRLSLLLLFLVLVLSGCATTLEDKVDHIRERNIASLQKQLGDKDLMFGAPMFIRIIKEEDVLEVWLQKQNSNQYDLFKTYGICALSGALGPKTSIGDYQAPEGFYSVTPDRLWPGSKYHLAMNIGYPNEYDAAMGYEGSALMIHGDCKSDGCFAMTTPYIEEIYILADAALHNGQPFVPVHIFPFRMSEENIMAHSPSPWMPFWRNLEQGYETFEASHIPPAVSVTNKNYVFSSAF